LDTDEEAIRFEVENLIISKRYERPANYYTLSVPALQKVLNDPHVAVLYYVDVRHWICNAIGVSRSWIMRNGSSMPNSVELA
jgi:hypothetical protein